MIHFSFPLNPAIHRMGNSPSILCSRNSKKDDSYLHFIFHWKLPKTTLELITGLINVNCTFNTPFKVSHEAKVILNGGLISQFPDSIYSNILPALLESVSQTFYKDGYDKINEVSYFKRSLASNINKLRDTAIDLGSKTFLKT